MKKHIAEGLPERKHSPAAAPAAKDDKKGDAKGGKSPEARVRQAVYDIRYRARREEVPLQKAFSDYMNHSTMSGKEKSLVRAKLFGKGGMQAEDFNIEDTASSNVANALYKVFVEGVKKEEPIVLTYMEKLETGADRKYKVRVTDKSGSSYVRYATREKISSLRANPNIESVEMTQYGEPYEGEKNRGERTAAAKAGKDYDGDGKVESGAKEYRGAVHNAIQRKKGGKPDGQDTSNVKEAFLADANGESVNPDANEPEIDVMKGKNVVKINPELPGSPKNTMKPSIHYAHYEAEGEVIAETDGYSKFLGMLQEKKMTKAEKTKEKKLKTKYDPSGMKASMKKQYGPEKGENVYFATIRKQAMKEEDEKSKMNFGKEYGCDDDSRAKYAEKEVIKNKLRAALGVKNPIVMTAGYETEGEMVDEARAEDKRGLTPTGAQRQRQKKGVVTSSGQVAHPATSYSGGQNPHLRGKGGGNKTQRREASRRYVDQPGGVYAKPESKQGEGRYAAMQAKKRFKPDLGSKYD
jgi:hypothetical protein